jgi:serine/threonine-protein kinase ATR
VNEDPIFFSELPILPVLHALTSVCHIPELVPYSQKALVAVVRCSISFYCYSQDMAAMIHTLITFMNQPHLRSGDSDANMRLNLQAKLFSNVSDVNITTWSQFTTFLSSVLSCLGTLISYLSWSPHDLGRIATFFMCHSDISVVRSTIPFVFHLLECFPHLPDVDLCIIGIFLHHPHRLLLPLLERISSWEGQGPAVVNGLLALLDSDREDARLRQQVSAVLVKLAEFVSFEHMDRVLPLLQDPLLFKGVWSIVAKDGICDSKAEDEASLGWRQRLRLRLLMPSQDEISTYCLCSLFSHLLCLPSLREGIKRPSYRSGSDVYVAELAVIAPHNTPDREACCQWAALMEDEACVNTVISSMDDLEYGFRLLPKGLSAVIEMGRKAGRCLDVLVAVDNGFSHYDESERSHVYAALELMTSVDQVQKAQPMCFPNVYKTMLTDAGAASSLAHAAATSFFVSLLLNCPNLLGVSKTVVSPECTALLDICAASVTENTVFSVVRLCGHENAHINDWAFFVLLRSMNHPSAEVRACSYDTLRLAGDVPRSLFNRLFFLIVEHEKPLAEEISYLPQFAGRNVLQELLPYAISDIVSFCRSDIIEQLGSFNLPKSFETLVWDSCLPTLLSDLLLRGNPPEAHRFIQERLLAGVVSVSKLLLSQLQHVLIYLVKRFATDFKPVHDALQLIPMLCGGVVGDVKDLLQGHFVPIMFALERDLYTPSGVLSGLTCLKHVILQLSDKARPFTTKIISCLKEVTGRFVASNSSLSNRQGEPEDTVNMPDRVSVASSVCGVWAALLRVLRHEGLRSLVGQVVHEMLPLIDFAPSATSTLLHYIIVDGKTTEMLPGIPQGVPELKAIYDWLDAKTAAPSLGGRLESLLPSLASESMVVRKFALIRVRELLRCAGKDFYSLLVKKDSRLCVSELVRRLLLNLNAQEALSPFTGSVLRSDMMPNPISLTQVGMSQDPSLSLDRPSERGPSQGRDEETLQGIAAECLSIVGAIDPNTLAFPSRELATISNDGRITTVRPFVVKLVTDFLAGILSSSDDKRYSRAGYAIQEVLKIVNILDNDSDVPAHVRELVDPFRSSTLSLRHVSDASRPQPSLPLSRWAPEFARYLIARFPDSSSEFCAVYKAVRSVLRDDVSLSLFLIPYLVSDLTAIDDKEYVASEMVSILRSSDSDSEVVQCVFGLTDTLRAWDEKLEVLRNIPLDVLAEAAYRHRAYARALLYIEEKIKSNADATDLRSERLLRQIYAKLDDPDALDGLIGSHSTIEDQILVYEKRGRYAEALTCYETLSQQSSSDDLLGPLDCMLHLGHHTRIIQMVDGILSKTSEAATILERVRAFGVQAAWRLQKWDVLQQYILPFSSNQPQTPGVGPGGLRLSLGFDALPKSSSDAYGGGPVPSISPNGGPVRDVSRITIPEVEFEMRLAESFLHKESIKKARDSLLPLLAAASTESYARAYPLLVKLHLLYDLEVHDEQLYQARLSNTLPATWVREPLLSARRTMLSGSTQLSTTAKNAEICNTWLSLTKLASREGHFQAATSAVLHALALDRNRYAYTHAKLLFRMGEHQQAIHLLESHMHNGMNDVKLVLLHTYFGGELKRRTEDDIITSFTAVHNASSRWEKPRYLFAKYLDELLSAKVKTINKDPARMLPIVSKYLPSALRLYGEALATATRHLYEIMPRMLTLWLEYSEVLSKMRSHEALNLLHKAINQKTVENRWIKRIPIYEWVIAVPQLMSRITASDVSTSALMRCILSSVVSSYPSQTCWLVVPGLHSSSSERKDRVSELLDEVSRSSSAGVINRAKELVENMILLAQSAVDKYDHANPYISFSSMSKVANFRRAFPYNEICVPTERSLVPQIMLSHALEPSWNPYPDQLVALAGMEDRIRIMASLQKPKQITVNGTDGQRYVFLAKQNDDSRKDNRLQEFNAVLNRLLFKDRRQQLYLRTFAVVPLSDDCGIIEWVSGTEGFKRIYERLYCKHVSPSFIKPTLINRIYEDAHRAGMGHTALFRDQLLPRFPLLFSRWFTETFPEPSAWYTARQRYTRTTAVWSMVGAMLGLGDRHGENILLDTTNGDTVHVDFDCLFHKGKSFPAPEVVPFRLTPNMIDAFGVTGVEGLFRNSCETVLRVMRHNRQTLLNVLETFVHDPLVEWSKPKGREVREHESPQLALDCMANRLDGIVDAGSRTVALAVEGQVARLIDEAMNPDNLARMFKWWFPAM